MEETPKKSGAKLIIFTTLVFITGAIFMVKWTMKNKSSEIDLSKEDYSAFNSSEGELKKASTAQYSPDLTDVGYSVRYRSGGTKDGTQEELDLGYQEGMLTKALAKNLKNPKAVDELFNNQWVIKGFMSRKAVQSILSSRQTLQDFLENTTAVKGFLADPVVKAAVSSPAVLAALTGSYMAKALLAQPAVQDLIKDYEGIESVVEKNPSLLPLLRVAGVKKAVLANPQAAPLATALGWK